MASMLKPFVINGEKIWVEVDDSREANSGKTERTSDDKIERTSVGDTTAIVDKLEDADIARVLKALVAPVRQALSTVGPDEFSVEVSIGIKGEVGFFVAKSEGNASLKVTAKWKAAGTKG